MSICLTTLVLRKLNGLSLLRGAIFSNESHKVTSGWKWPWVRSRPTTNSWVMPLNSTHIQRIEFTKVNSHMHSILSLSSLWTQCEFSKLIVNSWVLPEFSYLSSFCAKNVIQKEKIVCAKRENCLPADEFTKGELIPYEFTLNWV